MIQADPIRLRFLRNYRGLTQTELAAKAGLSRASVNYAEKGDKVQLLTLQKIADALKCRVNYLTGEVELWLLDL